MTIETKLNEKQGHWILARVGKRVLRPGGLELTRRLVNNLNIGPDDDLVEFAPGLGLTANLACAGKPNSYIGIDNNEAAAERARHHITYDRVEVRVADAAETTLPDACASKVLGEAILSMQSEEQKKAIIGEAARILKPGGYYGIHELGLYPDDLSEEVRKHISRELSSTIRVHARPLTMTEWINLLEGEGFRVITISTNPMHLLKPKRIIQDEGMLRTLKIAFNILTHRDFRVRIRQMHNVFRKYQDHLNAVAIVAAKR